MMTGTSGAIRFSSGSASMPPVRGMVTSRRMTAGRSAWTAATASSPSLASIVSNPAATRHSPSRARMLGSSSTTRIFPTGLLLRDQAMGFRLSRTGATAIVSILSDRHGQVRAPEGPASSPPWASALSPGRGRELRAVRAPLPLCPCRQASVGAAPRAAASQREGQTTSGLLGLLSRIWDAITSFTRPPSTLRSSRRQSLSPGRRFEESRRAGLQGLQLAQAWRSAVSSRPPPPRPSMDRMTRASSVGPQPRPSITPGRSGTRQDRAGRDSATATFSSTRHFSATDFPKPGRCRRWWRAGP